ncbi:acyl-CoA dehydrogenase family protein [uncultured Streptomyces sp.]|uniref:acyl-CoA dehydrogenase family protein n=1 Tax=uncultured Streptomyces sp. TaxID=174707 RepID=UPI00261A600C|nr:acyl-CoA dehydrogenase family protein [uncultured Streptomyces sp.]
MSEAPGEGTALATAPEVRDEPLVAAVRGVALNILRPAAERTAVEGVPRSHLDALARCGAFGLVRYEPAPSGGCTGRQVMREVHEILSAVDPSTWFVYTQHFALVKALFKSPNTRLREAWTPELVTGGTIATAGYAYLRQPRPPVTARKVEGGWRLTGRIPWMTGWGIADTAIVGAVAPDDRALFVRMDCGPGPGGGPAAVDSPPLWAMGGTHTAALELREVAVPDDDVISVAPRQGWAHDYDLENANAQPAVFGHLRAVVDLLLSAAPRAATSYERLAHRLADEGARLRTEAYALRDEVPAEQEVAARTRIRAAVLDLGVRAATAGVAATGGRAVRYGDTAGRLAREALFHLIKAQTPQLRSAMADITLDGLNGEAG